MYMLMLSLVGLLVAPPIYFLFRSKVKGAILLDRLVFIAVVGLVVVLILPHAFEHVGWLALVGALAGWGGLYLLECFALRSEERVHNIPVLLFSCWLVVHGLLDGAALANVGGHEHSSLPLAVVLHRVPAALLLWWLVYPRKGVYWASATLVVIGVTSILGFVFASHAIHALGHHAGVHLFESFMAGSLVHLAFHRRCEAPAAKVCHT